MEKLRYKLPINKPLPRLVPLIVPLVILSLSDSILSYTAPIYASNIFSTSLTAGLAISFSSLIGFIFDYLSKWLVGSKTFSYFIKISFILSITFGYLLGLSLIQKHLFILAMAVWGIYYETMAFSNYKYLKFHVDSANYSSSWGLITMIRSLVYGIGPLIATFMISYNLKLPAYLCATFVLVEFIIYLWLFKNPHESMPKMIVSNSKTEFKVWKVLFKRIYPLWVLNFVLLLTDSSFWTAGVLLSEKLGTQSPLGHLIMPLYMLPAVLISPLTQRFTSTWGEKRTAIVTAFLASLALIFMGLAPSIFYILTAVFGYAAFTAITYPALSSTFEDYIKRLGTFDTDLIGLEQSSISLAYIAGPTLVGLISLHIGNQGVFTIFGLLLLITSVLTLAITPRKIRMPQSELLNIT